MSIKGGSNNLVTKSYLKQELKNLETRLTRKFLTKEDAKKFATKDDLKGFATKKDIERLPTREEIEFRLSQFKEEIIEMLRKFRDDIYTKIDPILQEVVTAREEREVSNHRISTLDEKLENHEVRITKLEKASLSV
ncbi:MAG: hypothetical protein ACK4FL_01645 [Microgenomates group bacterium]